MRALVLDVTPEDTSVEAAPAEPATTEPAAVEVFAPAVAALSEELVVDYVSHVGEMLERTATDDGAAVQVIKSTDIYLFCAAVVSRKVMEVDA